MWRTVKACKGTFLLIALWTVLFFCSAPFSLPFYMSGRGIHVINQEYYRLLTGPLLHYNLLHLMANVAALYWVGWFLERHMGSIRFLLFGLTASTVSQFIYACLDSETKNHIGGSVWIFAFLGLLVALQFLKPQFPRFHLGTWYGNYILGYAILGNIPIFSFMSFGTIVTHLCAFTVGLVLGLLGIFCKLL